MDVRQNIYQISILGHKPIYSQTEVDDEMQSIEIRGSRVEKKKGKVQKLFNCVMDFPVFIQPNSNNWQESGNTYYSAGTQIPLILPDNPVLCPFPSTYLSQKAVLQHQL